MSIIVLGTVALDGVTTPSGRRNELLGGSAVHFSMAARLFTRVGLVAVIGRDFPPQHTSFLKRKGLDLASLSVGKGETFRWRGEYKGDLNTALTLRTDLGVLAEFKPLLSSGQARTRNVFLANVDPDIQGYLLDKMRSPQLVALDSMNYWIDCKKGKLLKLLKRVDIYVANDQEARELSGENNLFKAARALRGYGARMVLIKKGENGVFFQGDDFVLSLPAYPVEKVVDPTGAGDTFAGGFMGYLSRAGRVSRPVLKKALAYGTVAASFNIEGFGVERSSALRLPDLENRLGKFKSCFSL
ncbi:MAG: PfkB family carbohydrate kinase [Candidatus Omnitrophota bacterium]